MDLKNEKKENNLEVEESQFQQNLNKWFQDQGIITDLRSHLRYLMISALQRKQNSTKFIQKTSLKTQALNLLIAEYLFRLECHYTLSIFASEVPNLSNFSCLASFFKSSFYQSSSVLSFVEKQLTSGKNKLKKFFKENEMEEIFHALGFSLKSEELILLKSAYFKGTNDTTLLELFFSFMPNMSSKIDISKTNQRNDMQLNKNVLSVEWSLAVKQLILKEQIGDPQLSVLYNSLVSITENEVKRIFSNEHSQHVEDLIFRENRIRNYLVQCKKDIFVRLSSAKNDLILSKSLIDKKMMEKEKLLFKMVLEWNSKHEEIMELSKKFYIKLDENKLLKESLNEMKKKIKYHELQEKKQKEKIDKLQIKISLLINKLHMITECKNTLSNLFEDHIKKENILPLTAPKEITIKETYLKNCHLETYKSSTEDSHALRSSQDDTASASSSVSSEEILLKARNRLQILAKESLEINKNYWEYKNKYCKNPGSETLISSSSECTQQDVNSFQKIYQNENTNFMPQKKLSHCKKKKKIGDEHCFPFKKIDDDKKNTKDFENLSVSYATIKNFISKDRKELNKILKVPSQRQLKNRDCFLRSKQFLQKLDDKRIVDELLATTTTLSTSESSSEKLNKRFNIKMKYEEMQNLIQEPLPSFQVDNTSICLNDVLVEAKLKKFLDNTMEIYNDIKMDSNGLVCHENKVA